MATFFSLGSGYIFMLKVHRYTRSQNTAS